jgi:glutathione peroxidase
MNSLLSSLSVLTIAAVLGAAGLGAVANTRGKPDMQSSKGIYDFVVQDIGGKDVSLGQFKGKVLLVVNVASQCDFTPQYAGLEALYQQKKDRGLVVLGFPANDFGSQEPGTNAEIKQFCSENYHVTFPMFAKITVKGAAKHPLYRLLTEKATDPNFAAEIRWNFTKFVIGRDGSIRNRFDSRLAPDNAGLVGAVDQALGKEAAVR